MTDPEENAEILQSLWEPHPSQAAIMALDARFRIIAAGRRFGKTALAAHEAIAHALEHPGAVVYWVAPTYQQANDFGFDRVKRLVARDVLDDVTRSTPRKIHLSNGSTLSFRSGEREDSLRGPGIDFLVIDEAGSVPERAWTEELRPALADTEGELLAIGTPRGRNWFYQWYQRGQSPDHPDVASVRATTEQNPHVPNDEIDAAREQMPERKFRQEFLAEFVDDTGGVFRDVRDAVTEYSLPVDASDAPGPFAIGVDFARLEDYTALVVLDGDGRLVDFDRLTETTWHRIQKRIERAAEEYGRPTVAVDATRDNAIIDDLEDAGLSVEPVNFASKKETLVDNLATRLEAGEVGLSADAPVLINELEVYEYERTDSGRITYSAPSGRHDDAVDALALAVHAAEHSRGRGGAVELDWGDDSISAPSMDDRRQGATRPADTAPDALTDDDTTNIF
jgi:phage terminase large subunit-like protein